MNHVAEAAAVTLYEGSSATEEQLIAFAREKART
jgi:hypothetical protein